MMVCASAAGGATDVVRAGAVTRGQVSGGARDVPSDGSGEGEGAGAGGTAVALRRGGAAGTDVAGGDGAGWRRLDRDGEPSRPAGAPDSAAAFPDVDPEAFVPAGEHQPPMARVAWSHGWGGSRTHITEAESATSWRDASARRPTAAVRDREAGVHLFSRSREPYRPKALPREPEWQHWFASYAMTVRRSLRCWGGAREQLDYARIKDSLIIARQFTAPYDLEFVDVLLQVPDVQVTAVGKYVAAMAWLPKNDDPCRSSTHWWTCRSHQWKGRMSCGGGEWSCVRCTAVA